MTTRALTGTVLALAVLVAPAASASGEQVQPAPKKEAGAAKAPTAQQSRTECVPARSGAAANKASGATEVCRDKAPTDGFNTLEDIVAFGSLAASPIAPAEEAALPAVTWREMAPAPRAASERSSDE